MGQALSVSCMCCQGKVETRHYLDLAGVQHTVQFRETDHCRGDEVCEIVVDDVLLSQVDAALYDRLLKLPTPMLADYFSRH